MPKVLRIAPGVVNATTPRGTPVVLVSDPDGDYFVVEQRAFDGWSSAFVAHRRDAHPALPAGRSRFARLK